MDLSSTQGALCTVSVIFYFTYLRGVRRHPMHPPAYGPGCRSILYIQDKYHYAGRLRSGKHEITICSVFVCLSSPYFFLALMRCGKRTFLFFCPTAGIFIVVLYFAFTLLSSSLIVSYSRARLLSECSKTPLQKCPAPLI